MDDIRRERYAVTVRNVNVIINTKSNSNRTLESGTPELQHTVFVPKMYFGRVIVPFHTFI